MDVYNGSWIHTEHLLHAAVLDIKNKKHFALPFLCFWVPLILSVCMFCWLHIQSGQHFSLGLKYILIPPVWKTPHKLQSICGKYRHTNCTAHHALEVEQLTLENIRLVVWTELGRLLRNCNLLLIPIYMTNCSSWYNQLHILGNLIRILFDYF